MKTVASTTNLNLKVSKDEIINGKWLCYSIMSKKVAEAEIERKLPARGLRTKLYNSDQCNKYNISTIAGIKCIDITQPMKSNNASLVLSFDLED